MKDISTWVTHITNREDTMRQFKPTKTHCHSRIIKKTKEEKVQALFIEPQYPSKSAEMIAKETKTKIYTLDPVVTGPDNLDAYITIMSNNIQILREALTR